MGSATLTLAFGASGTSSASAASASRHALYVDPATQSVGVSVNGTASQYVNVGASSPNCTAGANNLLTCTITFSAPYGNDTFAISLYSGANGTGAVIGTASASGDVSYGAPLVVDATVSTNYSVYLANETNIEIYNEAGALQTSLPIPATQVALDDAGNIYDLYSAPTPAPSGTPAPGIVQRYAAGSTSPSATYQTSLSYPEFIQVSGSGEVGVLSDVPPNATTFNLDVWNPGVSGAPSYTFPLSFSGGVFFFSVRSDGTIYTAINTGTSAYYQVYAPGSSTPSRIVPETLVSPANIANFSPNYMTVGADGTLYVTEYSFVQPDSLTGLYIYPPSGPERFVATTSDANGGGAEGVAIDGAGNVYVANDNNGVIASTCLPGPPVTCNIQSDSLHDIEVFSPGATSLLRHITGNFVAAPIVAAPDGTIFFCGFPGSFGAFGNSTAPTGAYIIPAGGTAATMFSTVANDIIYLYDGNQQLTAGYRRHDQTYSFVAAAAHGGAGGMSRYVLRFIQHQNALLKRK